METPLLRPQYPYLFYFCRAWWGDFLHQTLLTAIPSPFRSVVLEARGGKAEIRDRALVSVGAGMGVTILGQF